MNVKELIAVLREFDSLTPILVARDEEGNGFNALATVEEGWIHPNEDKHGYVDDLADSGDDDDFDGLAGGYEARVVIWP